jgi:pre-mRNA-splicing factor SYF1
VELYKASGDLRAVIVCYTEAVKTVDPFLAVGKPQELWLGFASFYEQHGDVASSRTILGRATLAPFKQVDDLAAVRPPVYVRAVVKD